MSPADPDVFLRLPDDDEDFYEQTPAQVYCPYCKQLAKLVDGTKLYPGRDDLANKRFYRCAPCDAHVGVHEGTMEPFGTLANAELRAARQQAHAAFDPHWNKVHRFSRSSARRYAYRKLAQELGVAEVHIGEADVETCRRIVDVCVGWCFSGVISK